MVRLTFGLVNSYVAHTIENSLSNAPDAALKKKLFDIRVDTKSFLIKSTIDTGYSQSIASCMHALPSCYLKKNQGCGRAEKVVSLKP